MRRRSFFAVPVAALLAAGALAVPTPASAAVRDCSVPTIGKRFEISSVRNMTCTRARTVMRGYRGSIRRTFATGGFTCRLVAGRLSFGQWRCTDDSGRAFRVDHPASDRG
ncbi:MAG: hypothetical protein U0R70_17455 [Solirubrobacteraceae bacterium]